MCVCVCVCVCVCLFIMTWVGRAPPNFRHFDDVLHLRLHSLKCVLLQLLVYLLPLVPFFFFF